MTRPLNITPEHPLNIHWTTGACRVTLQKDITLSFHDLFNQTSRHSLNQSAWSTHPTQMLPLYSQHLPCCPHSYTMAVMEKYHKYFQRRIRRRLGGFLVVRKYLDFDQVCQINNVYNWRDERDGAAMSYHCIWTSQNGHSYSSGHL